MYNYGEKVKSFCCLEKAVKYDEYDEKLTFPQKKGVNSNTSLSSFNQNILSKDVLDVEVSQYLEKHWPLGDDEFSQTHKLFRLVFYPRCSRWIFNIFGKNVQEFSLRVFAHVTNLLREMAFIPIFKKDMC